MTRLKAFQSKYAVFLNASPSSIVSATSLPASAAAVNRSAISAYFKYADLPISKDLCRSGVFHFQSQTLKVDAWCQTHLWCLHISH